MDFNIQLPLLIFVSTAIMLVMNTWMLRLRRKAPMILGAWASFVLLLSIGVYGMTQLEREPLPEPFALSSPHTPEEQGVHTVSYQVPQMKLPQEGSQSFWPFLFLQTALILFFAVWTFALLYAEGKDRSREYALQLSDATKNWMRSKNETARARQTKEFFLANMSHEIRTPLNAILGLSEVLDMRYRNLGSSEDRIYNEELLAIIRQNGANLTDVIDHILLYSQLESRQILVHLSSFNFREFLSRLDTQLKQKFNGCNGNPFSNARLEFTEGFPVETVSDEMNLKPLLECIWENAIRFSNDGEVLVRCRLVKFSENMNPAIRWDAQLWEPEKYPAYTPSVVSVDIEDDGAGIPSSEIKAIFQPFHQADSSSTRKHGGLGLGLAIAKKLAEELDGDISVTSEPGKGTRFTVSFPALVLM